ncbi:hypothetical protein M2152_000080 [Microbacteriaceae bacterium SG_E_30_P1]|uniref:Uncharacterized protein n=1 Tax=Antiquaquibacter oligotrophicus TaxID=2880260 RepID=A0ABT6KIW7_9MICO|nr:hypothetical protein [Antiquaquibacter oligotrophicus]MDH6179898.1 hypothetical protein [Antiquaquibacter oligotrophicus]UDF14342.1 hypothetical protein LH407_05625 [Antiquaquibacter oligotrophicus]
MSGTRVLTRKPSAAPDAPAFVAAVPRVDLLPPEVHEQRKMRSTRSTILLLAILAIVVVGGGYAFATLRVMQTSLALAAEQERTLDLLAQQQEFIEVRHIQSRVTASEAAERVGTSTEVDWTNLLGQVVASQPAGMSLVTVDIQSVTPTTPFPQPTVPLQGPRIAAVKASFSSGSPIDSAALIESLSTNVVGAAEVLLVDTGENEGVFTSNLVIYVDKDALVVAEGEVSE